MQKFRISEKALDYVFGLLGVVPGKMSLQVKNCAHLSQDTQKRI